MEHKKMFAKLILFILILQTKSAASDRLTDFVTEKFSNFTTWLKASNLDPTPAVTGPSHLTSSNAFFQMDNELRNYYVQGHSNNLEIKGVDGELLYGYFSIQYRLRDNIAFQGEHVSSGTLLHLTITGDGSWRLDLPNLDYTCRVDFEVLQSGYLNITGQSASSSGFNVEELYFENLSDHDAIVSYRNYFNETMLDSLFRAWGRIDPLPEYCTRYWSEIIPETHLADIIDTMT